MLDLNQYTTAQRAEYFRTIWGFYGAYFFKTTVQLLNNQHGVVSTVSHVLLDGQVDAEAVIMRNGQIEPSRTAQLQFCDPGHTMALDSTSPTDGAVYLNRMIRIIVSVRCPSGWVDVPVFTGPITEVPSRDGDIVNVNAAGKETFGLRSAWEPYTYKKGYKVNVLRGLLIRAGETTRYMALPKSDAKIAKPIVIGRETQLWNKAYALTSSMNRILFYDARGIVKTTPKTTKPVITFRKGQLLLSSIQSSFNSDNMKNAAIVRGGNPVGPKKFVSATVVAPRSNSLSPFNIGRDPVTGRGGFLTIREENPNLRTTLKCVAHGKQLLDDHMRMHTEATWDSMPVWHQEPWDMVNLVGDEGNFTVRMGRFSLPLVPVDAVMTCGYTTDLKKPRVLVRG